MGCPAKAQSSMGHIIPLSGRGDSGPEHPTTPCESPVFWTGGAKRNWPPRGDARGVAKGRGPVATRRKQPVGCDPHVGGQFEDDGDGRHAEGVRAGSRPDFRLLAQRYVTELRCRLLPGM